jgi:outer membrane biosynthesis protein TonB
MAKDDDKLIRIFRALTPPWPIGVAITPQMREAFNWLVQHRDERDTDAYRDIHDWLAEQMGLSPDTLAPLSSRPSPSSAPATSPPTEHTAEPATEPPSVSEPIAEPMTEPVAEPNAEPEPRDEPEPETSTVEALEPESNGRKRRSERATIHRTMKLGEATMAKIKGTSLDSAAEMDELVILNRGARARGEGRG